jgi:nucleoside-diphosphate-sugar epimerase
MNGILVTGADGFIGRSLIPMLGGIGHTVLASVRGLETPRPGSVDTIQTGDLRARPDWSEALKGVAAVVHLAGRAHVIQERESAPISAFRAVNTQPTAELFEACQRAAVSRFVFVSTIGVNGTSTRGRAFTEIDEPNPAEPYAVSKWEAEQALLQLAAKGATQLVILRPTLIYGPHAKGNFLRLMALVDKGWPLPFGSLSATRSLLGLTNFCWLIARCLRHSFPTPEIYVAADPQPFSTRELILALGVAMNRKVRLVRLPTRLLTIMGSSIGQRSAVERLITSLEVDSSKARTTLNWQPKLSFEAELQAMVDEYLRSKKDRPMKAA